MAIPTMFNMTRDINGYNGFGVDFSNTNWNTTLSANAEQHFTVSGQFAVWLAVFSFNGSDIWVANNTTAAVPTSSFAATQSQFCPNARRVKAGDVLSFITSDTTAQIGVSLYAIG